MVSDLVQADETAPYSNRGTVILKEGEVAWIGSSYLNPGGVWRS
jgi:hypothetical protein